MLIISLREFRAKQKSYLDQVDEGAEILLTRGNKKSYKIVPVQEDDTLMSKDDFFAKVDRAAKSIQEGNGVTIHDREELLAYLGGL